MPEEKTWLEDRKLTFDAAERIKKRHSRRMALNERYLRKRYDLPDDVDEITRVNETDIPPRRRGYNLAAEIQDSAAAQVCRPLKTSLVPVGGDPETTANCRVKNRLVDGVMENVDFLQIATRMYLDELTVDIGVCAWDWVDGQFTCERLLGNQFFWELDKSSKPSAFFYEDFVPRRRLMERYPQHRAIIRDLPRDYPKHIEGVDVDTPGMSGDVDTVKVWRAEAPASGGVPGRYVLAAKGLLLEDRVWNYPRTRFVVSRWSDDYRGFGGVSLFRRIEPYHDRVRALAARIDRALKGAVPTISATEDAAADATFSDLDFNKVVYPVGAKEPRIYVPSVVSPEIIQQLERDYARAAAEAGASQTLANGTGPMGITSGKGLREYVAIANQRLILQQLIWKRIWIEAAHVILMLGDAMFSNEKARKMMKPVRLIVAGRDWIEEAKWLGPDKLKEEQYKVQMQATSGMSNTTAGKYEDIAQLQQLGVATPAIVARALTDSMPDVAQISDELNGPLDYADHLISKAVDEGEFIPPSTIAGQHLNTCLSKAQNRFLQMSIKPNVPRKNLAALRTLISSLQTRIKAQPAPVPGPMPNAQSGASQAPSAMPGAAPGQVVA